MAGKRPRVAIRSGRAARDRPEPGRIEGAGGASRCEEKQEEPPCDSSPHQKL